MAAEFLADENEREDGADYYIAEFGKSRKPGEPINLLFKVGPIKDEKTLTDIQSFVQSSLSCRKFTVEKAGFLFKRPLLIAELSSIPLTREQMLKITNTQYDVILRFEVKVEVNVA